MSGHYKLTVNQETYPLPQMEDMLPALSGGKEFSTIDLLHAYLQVQIKDDCKKYLTKGLFEFNHLPFRPCHVSENYG